MEVQVKDTVKVKHIGLSFTGKVTRVGADKGEKTKVQIQNEEGGKPLWYPITAVIEKVGRPDVKEGQPLYHFWFAGAKKLGYVKEDNGGEKVVMHTTGKHAAPYTVNRSEVEFDGSYKKPGTGEDFKASELGEKIIAFLQKNTEQSEEVVCKTIDEVADGTGKTQPQIKAALKALLDGEVVLQGVCDNNANTVALTPDGFAYKVGLPSKKANVEKVKKVTKADRIVALYYEGKTNKEITEIVGCDPSYPSWLIKEKIKKGEIKPLEK